MDKLTELQDLPDVIELADDELEQIVGGGDPNTGILDQVKDIVVQL